MFHRLHRLGGAAAARAAALAAHDELVHAGETDEDIDDRFDHRPLAEKHVHQVPVSVAHEMTETDEAPVQGSDDNESAHDGAKNIFLTHNGKMGRNKSTLVIEFYVRRRKFFPCTSLKICDEIIFDHKC